MNLNEGIEQFSAELRRRGLSNRTIAAYQFDLSKFLEYLKKNNEKDSSYSLIIASISSSTIKKWVDSQLVLGNSPRTVARKLSSLKAFLKFSVEEKWVQTSPMDDVSPPKFRRQPPEAMSQDEIRQLLQSPDPDSPNFLRDRAIIYLLYSCGLRLNELVSLKQEAVDFDQQIVRVHGKGSKDRIIPLMDNTRKCLVEYAIKRDKDFPKSSSPKSPFFLRAENTPLSHRIVQYMLEKHGKQAGIRSHIHPHLLRHSIATHLVEEGANLDAVRQTLGHEDLSTTSIYLKTSKKFLFSEHKKHNPLDKLSKISDHKD